MNKWLASFTIKLPRMRKDSEKFKRASMKAFRVNDTGETKDNKVQTVRNMSEHFTVFLEIATLKDTKDL